MRAIYFIIACLILACSVVPIVAGEFNATFNQRLTCPYSSFVIGGVTRVHGGSIDVTVQRRLYRTPPAERFTIRLRHQQHYAHGEQLLINCWDFPPAKQLDWMTFPASFYQGKRHSYHILAVVCGGGTLHPEGPTDLGGLAMLSWLFATGNWQVQFKRKNDWVYYAVFSDGRRETITVPAFSQQRNDSHIRALHQIIDQQRFADGVKTVVFFMSMIAMLIFLLARMSSARRTT